MRTSKRKYQRDFITKKKVQEMLKKYKEEQRKYRVEEAQKTTQDIWKLFIGLATHLWKQEKKSSLKM